MKPTKRGVGVYPKNTPNSTAGEVKKGCEGFKPSKIVFLFEYGVFCVCGFLRKLSKGVLLW